MAGSYGRDLVDKTELRDQRGHVRLTGAHHQPRSGLTEEVKTSRISVRASRSEGGDGSVYQPGVDLPQIRVGHALFLHSVGTEVGHEDVALGYQAVGDLFAFRLAQVQGNAL